MSELHRVITEYDPENDTPASGPAVTWADIAIVRAVLKLSRRLDVLENQPPEPGPAGLLDALREWVKLEQADIDQERGRAGGIACAARVKGRDVQLANLVAFLDGYTAGE